MSLVFGKNGIQSYTLYDRRNNVVVPYELISARIYSNTPTVAQIQDSLNTDPGDALAVNSGDWTNGFENGEKLIPFGAIADPGTNIGQRFHLDAWLVVSFRLQSAGEIINDALATQIMRVAGALSRYGVSKVDVQALDSAIKDFGEQVDIDAKIKLAERLVTIDLETDMISLERIEQADAKELVTYKAAILSFSDLQNQRDDTWQQKKKDWQDEYNTLRTKIKVAWDKANTTKKDALDKADFAVVHQER